MEILIVRSTSHRKMQGTKHHSEHLMRCRGFRSVRNSYGTCKTTFSCVEIKETYGFNYPESKPHFFSSDRGKKPEFLGAIVGLMGPKIYVGSWALFEDVGWFEDK